VHDIYIYIYMYSLYQFSCMHSIFFMNDPEILLVAYYQLLDLLLGKDRDALFRLAELKTLVDLCGNDVLFSIYHLVH
jgi:hypothetical protein